MDPYLEKLKAYIKANPPKFGDGDSVLTLLYEAYADNNRMDDDHIKRICFFVLVVMKPPTAYEVCLTANSVVLHISEIAFCVNT